jgi:hypothetical protein
MEKRERGRWRRAHVEHVQKGSLGGTDSGVLGNDLNVRDDLDGSSSNLRGDLKRLEERGLSGLHSGVSGGNEDIDGGEGTSSGRSSDLVGENDVSDVLEVTGGEDESNVALDVGEELLELGVLGEDGSEGSSDHGVLSHQDGGLASEGLSDLVHWKKRGGKKGRGELQLTKDKREKGWKTYSGWIRRCQRWQGRSTL